MRTHTHTHRESSQLIASILIAPPLLLALFPPTALVITNTIGTHLDVSQLAILPSHRRAATLKLVILFKTPPCSVIRMTSALAYSCVTLVVPCQLASVTLLLPILQEPLDLERSGGSGLRQYRHPASVRRI